jgi:hypothetical protein
MVAGVSGLAEERARDTCERRIRRGLWSEEALEFRAGSRFRGLGRASRRAARLLRVHGRPRGNRQALCWWREPALSRESSASQRSSDSHWPPFDFVRPLGSLRQKLRRKAGHIFCQFAGTLTRNPQELRCQRGNWVVRTSERTLRQ